MRRFYNIYLVCLLMVSTLTGLSTESLFLPCQRYKGPVGPSNRADSPRTRLEAKLEKFHLIPAEAELANLSNTAYRAFYRGNVWVYKFLSTQDETFSKAFHDNWKSTLSLLKDLPDEDPLKNVMLAEIYGKRAALEFLQENYFTALRYVRTCHVLIKKNQENFPDNIEQLKFLGLFNIVFSAVPKKYQWLSHTFGYKGDMATGMKQLEKASQHSTLLRTEAHLVAFYAEKNMLAQPEKAIQRMEAERKRLGPGILIDYLLASAYSSLTENEKAFHILQGRDTYARDPNVFFISYWDYLMGKVYYYKENYSEAAQYFSTFLDTHKGSLYRMDAVFRMGMTLSLSGEDERAKLYFKKMNSTVASPFDEDEYAMHMAQKFSVTPPGPSLKQLFRARNLFDGGYLPKALKVLDQVNQNKTSLSAAERVELFYRYGRIYHSMGNILAIENYERCATEPETGQKWMQAYAWFYLGQIARDQDRKEDAKVCFKKAMMFDDYFYQAGLENRCKTALSELKR